MYLNPADVVLRGFTPRELLEHSLWANGNPFLLQSSSNWPSLLDSVNNLSDRRSVALIGSVCIDSSSNCKFLYCFDKLQRVFAYIYRLISNFRVKSAPLKGRLSVAEINSGTVLLLRSIQHINLAKEYGSLSKGKPFRLDQYSAPMGYFAWVERFKTQPWTTIRGIRYCCPRIIQSPRRS